MPTPDAGAGPSEPSDMYVLERFRVNNALISTIEARFVDACIVRWSTQVYRSAIVIYPFQTQRPREQDVVAVGNVLANLQEDLSTLLATIRELQDYSASLEARIEQLISAHVLARLNALEPS